MLVDCHAHIYPPEFTDIPTILANAKSFSISAIINVPESLPTAHTVLSLSHLHPLLHPSLGLHPVQPATASTPAHSITLADLPPILSLIQSHSSELTSIGECGLDFSPHVLALTPHIPPSDLKLIQQRVFAAHITASVDLNIPLNVHSRQAGHYAVDMVVASGARALFHAFDGKAGYAMRAVRAGNLVSVAPSVVRSEGLSKLVKAVPIESLVLESDSPALAAVQGEMNQPSEIRVACEAVAQIKGMRFEDVERITTENALRFFPNLKLVE
ncbi:cell-death-related nuclease family member-like protein [Fimicolochytrium jonesii]|uniref:cell-death-related nuclease family member-like protein n=1 Tax=Fimicolochytrium jonesii TaxID=1396493 RepID=UPI0022FF2D1A|nr:cell-death-related nuclease family member-like protein [Fimicolochytrium jonesii]KAI8820962.1 cell-death-related nuclease family member-like protein [Fimicolochytrium jonesii]